MLIGSRYKPAWLLGTAGLSLAKILENMEIGHNVMHGQWDWMNDPNIHSSTWDWDTASPAAAWKHSHNYVHHTFTNIIGKDKDVGYEIMRIDPQQPWHPVYLFQPLYNVLLMAFFEWGVALHDLDFEAIRNGEKSKKQVLGRAEGDRPKARRQIVKDYVAFPRHQRPAFGKERLPHARSGQLHREHRAQRLVATRSSSAATSPTRRTRSPRTRSTTRSRGALVRAAADRRREHRRRPDSSTS